MPNPDSTLGAIRSKVRRLTRSPSIAQITDAQIDEYINTFILYDFPESLRLFSLRTTLDFFTQPNVDTYVTNVVDPLDPLYEFVNRYVAVHQPVFIAGVPASFTQDRSSFYSMWPQTNALCDTGLRGNGPAGPYVGDLTATTGVPVLPKDVTFSTTDANDDAQVLVDYAITSQVGVLGIPGAFPGNPSPYGAIDYITGAYTLTFPANVPQGTVINASTIPYQPSKPISMLYFDDAFILRPVPDKVYAVSIEVDARPTALLAAGDIPQREQWWQYVAYGAAIKIFQDRMDMEAVQMLFPEFQRQEDMVGRASLVQYANERTKTIYTQGKNYGAGWFMSNWPY